MRAGRLLTGEHWVERLRFWPLLAEVKTVFCFLPLADEPDTTVLIDWMLRTDKTVCVPYCQNRSGEMTAVCFSEKQGCTDALGISSVKGIEIPPEQIDLALIPGLAFDICGNRLGRGLGFYDRFLSSGFRGVKCGICSASRFLNKVPTSPHDIGVDYIFTPYGLYKPRIRR